jgi:uncharacterized protein (DUF1501 family)
VVLPTRHGHRHNIGISRRELLQVGYSGLLGVGLSGVLAGRARTAEERGAKRPAKKRSVLLIFLTGAASQLDLFDLKPDAPAEIRGEFKPIATKTPGVQISEHLPRLAGLSEKWAMVRTLSHRENNHLLASHMVLTGALVPGGFFDKVASRTDFPCYASALDYLRPRNDGIPSGVTMPTHLVEGPLTWPGQHAGFLGSTHDPWMINQDPNSPKFRVDNLSLPAEFNVDRLNDRKALLDQVRKQQRQAAETAETKLLASQQEQALTILTSGKVARAFDLDREPDAVRDRYGRHMFGQSLLLSRRLIEAGVPVVQANMGRVQTWDHHGDIFPTLKNRLLPPLDRGVSALLEDLDTRGLLEDTFVLMLGEFGRTPKISGQPAGRDHWAPLFSAVFAGGGVRGGQVIGKSDKIGAYPATTPYSYADIAATVYQVLGIDPDVDVQDRQGRPVRLNNGQAILPLFA